MSETTATGLCLEALPLSLPIGVQSFDFNALFSHDFPGTCQALAAFGFQLIDYIWLGRNPNVSPAVHALTGADVRRIFDDAGLECRNCHFSWAEWHEDYAGCVATARALGAESVVCHALATHAKSADEWRWQAGEQNALAARLKAEGFTSGYHNYPLEFTDVDGVTPYDLLMRETDPALIQFQIDTGNVAIAGKDPVAYLEKYAPRYYSIHLKDARGGRLGVGVGEGELDWKRILAATRTMPLRHYIIEAGSPHIEKLGESIAFLRTLKP